MLRIIHNQKKLVYIIIVLGLVLLKVHLAYGLAGETSLNPLKNIDSLDQLIKAIANIVLEIGSVVAVIFIIWSGFLFVTARGNEEQLKKARSTFTWTVIGTAVLLGAYVIATAVVQFVKDIS